MDLEKLSMQQLKQLLENCNKQSAKAEARALAKEVASELIKRGEFASTRWKGRWNPEEVAEVLFPFAEIAKEVKNNMRTTYTTAGGLHIGKKKEDPEWKFVDSYSGIKTGNVNATITCYVDRPGDDAWFVLRFANRKNDEDLAVEMEGSEEILDTVLERWKEIARIANESS